MIYSSKNIFLVLYIVAAIIFTLFLWLQSSPFWSVKSALIGQLLKACWKCNSPYYYLVSAPAASWAAVNGIMCLVTTQWVLKVHSCGENQQKNPLDIQNHFLLRAGQLCKCVKWWRSHRCNGRSTNEAFQASVFCWREEFVFSFFVLYRVSVGLMSRKLHALQKINLPLIYLFSNINI